MPDHSPFPPTQLRKYSQALKTLKEQEVTALAELHAADPTRLIGRIRESVKTVDRYPPIVEPFRARDPKPLPAPSTSVTSGLGLAAHVFQKPRWSVGGEARLGFRPLDREISTLRSTGTPKAARADKRAIDLLLANSADGTVVVGEIKVGGDVTTYLALVQALMYAVEMATTKQIQRVHDHVDTGVRVGARPEVDIYLIGFAAPVRAQYRGRIDAASRTICERLMDSELVSERIRRIAYLEAMIAPAGLQFAPRYAFGR